MNYKDPILKSKKKPTSEVDSSDFAEDIRNQKKNGGTGGTGGSGGKKYTPMYFEQKSVSNAATYSGSASLRGNSIERWEFLRGKWVGSGKAPTYGYISKLCYWRTNSEIYTERFTNPLPQGVLAGIENDGSISLIPYHSTADFSRRTTWEYSPFGLPTFDTVSEGADVGDLTTYDIKGTVFNAVNPNILFGRRILLYPALSVQTLSLDVEDDGIQETIYRMQKEFAGKSLRILLEKEGELFDLSECFLLLSYDGELYQIAQFNPIEFAVPQFVFNTAGEKDFSVLIIKEGEVLYSPAFKIVVEALPSDITLEWYSYPSQFQSDADYGGLPSAVNLDGVPEYMSDVYLPGYMSGNGDYSDPLDDNGNYKDGTPLTYIGDTESDDWSLEQLRVRCSLDIGTNTIDIREPLNHFDRNMYYCFMDYSAGMSGSNPVESSSYSNGIVSITSKVECDIIIDLYFRSLDPYEL